MSVPNASTYPRLQPAVHGTLLFLAAFVCLFLFMDRSINVYDEGIVLTASMLVGAGEFIHRDFYANYGPGEFYLLCWLFDAFGHRIIVERAFDLSVRAGILLLVYLTTRRHAGQGIAALVSLVCAGWLALVGNSGYPVYPALLLAIVSTWGVVRMLSGETRRQDAFLTGIVAGGVGLFRYDIGAFTCAAHALTALLVLLLDRRPLPPLRALAGPGLRAYVAGFAVPVCAVGALYAAQGALPGLVHDVIAFPAAAYAATRSLPFPTLRGVRLLEKASLLSIYLPLLIGAGILAGGLGQPRLFVAPAPATPPARSGRDARAVFVIAFAFLSLLYYGKGVVRVSVEHMQLSLIPALLALAAFAGLAGRARAWIRLGVAGLLALALLSAVAMVALRTGERQRVVGDLGWLSGFMHGTPGFVLEKSTADRLAGLPARPLLLVDADRDAALDYLVRHLDPRERLFVGVSHHDRIFANDVSAYFLAQKLPVTRWHHFDPGLQTSRAVQGEIVADIERARPACIWLDSTWDQVQEPNASAVSSGVHLLDDYIGAHYALSQAFGTTAIWCRKAGART